MGLLEDLQELIPDEAGKGKAKELIGEEAGRYVPRTRLNEEIEKAKLTKQQLEALDGKLKEMEKAGTDVEALKKERESWTQKEADYNAQLETLRKDGETKEALLKAKAKNTAAVMALLDRTKPLDEQINTLKKSDPYLFGDTVKLPAQGTPADKQEPRTQRYTREQVAGMSQAEVSKNYKEIKEDMKSW